MLALQRRKTGADEEEHVGNNDNESRDLAEVHQSDIIGFLPTRIQNSTTKDVSRATDQQRSSPSKPDEIQELTSQPKHQDPVRDSEDSFRSTNSWPIAPTSSFCDGSQETDSQRKQPSKNATQVASPEEVSSTHQKGEENYNQVFEAFKSQIDLATSPKPAQTYSESFKGSPIYQFATGSLRPFRRRKPQPWPDPQQSLGNIINNKKIKDKVWYPEGPALQLFNEKILPQIEKLLRNIESPQAQPLFTRLYMIGKSDTTASPTIMILCEDKKLRKDAEAIVRGSDILQQFPQVGLGHRATGPETDAVPVPVTGRSRTSHAGTHSPSNIEVYSPQEPVIGRRMRFVKRAEGRETVQLATGGAFVRIEEHIYQLTAIHTGQRDIPLDSISQVRFSPDDGGYGGQFYTNDASDLEAAQVDSDSDDCEYDGQYETDYESDFEEGYILSPPLREVPTYKPEVEPRSPSKADHDTETTLERQDSWNPQVSPNRSKIDYLLVRLSAGEASKATNTIGQPQGYHGLQVTDIGAASSSPREVIVVTSSQGYHLLTGTILPGAWRTKMHGFYGFQDLLLARLSRPIQPGDSGSAVVDAKTGRFYGHIVLGSAPDTVVYIVPSTEIFADIIELFGTIPSLHVTASDGARLERNPSGPGRDQEQQSVNTNDVVYSRPESQRLLEHTPAPNAEPEKIQNEAFGSEGNAVPLWMDCGVGKVYQVVWSEPTSSEDRPGAAPSRAYLDQIPTGYRQFILIRKEPYHVTCIPILDYGNLGCAGDQLKPYDHGIIYDQGNRPALRSREPELGFAPIRFDPSSHHYVGQGARVDYTKRVHVEYGVQVTVVGMVPREHWMIVTNAVRSCWNRADHRNEAAVLLRANAFPTPSHVVN